MARITAGSLLAALLLAIGNPPPAVAWSGEVVESRVVYVLPVDRAQARPQFEADQTRFIVRAGSGNPAALHVSLPFRYDQHVQRLLVRLGVPKNRISFSPAGGKAYRGDIVATLVIAGRAAPGGGVWPCAGRDVYGAFSGGNDPDPGLGCTDAYNLAASVARPADLRGNFRAPLRDGERLSVPVTRYRAFQRVPIGGESLSRSGLAPGVPGVP